MPPSRNDSAPPCAADSVPARVTTAMTLAASTLQHDDGHTDCYYAGLFIEGFRALLSDEAALHRLRYAYLNSPPHGVTHDDAARRAHMRAALIAALDEKAPDGR